MLDTMVFFNTQGLGGWSENGCEKLHFLVWNRVRIWRTGRHNPTKNSQENPPPPGAGPSITYLFSFGIAFTIWTNQEPISRKAWKVFGLEDKFRRQILKSKQAPWSRTCLTRSLKQVLAFLKFCTLGQKDFKIYVASVLVFLLIAGAHSYFYINTSLVCRF